MSIILTDEQRYVVQKAIDFYYHGSEQVMNISGSAGTGKSVVMNAIVESLGLDKHTQVYPMAYSGTATIVMRMKGLPTAKTIHSSIYETRVITDKNELDEKTGLPKTKIIFSKKKALGYDARLILIDEASMVPRRMLSDLLSFGVKIIACGDLNQLPPVASDGGAFLDKEPIYRLTQIMRQAEGNPIVHFANKILNDEPLEPGFYRNLIILRPDQLTDSMLLHTDILLCTTNRERDFYNNYIRSLHGRSNQLPEHGDRLICRKNNWKMEVDGISLANGLTGMVTSFPDLTCFSENTFTIDFEPYLFPTTFKDLHCDFNYFIGDIPTKQLLKNDPYSPGEKFEYAYAITVHLSQGSQYVNGIYVQGPSYWDKETSKKLNYTAITRFAKDCFYVLPE